jgi:amino acid transporter/mannitol/fructose-specific phosphotransferase system IIA component (Ntr-type)
MKQKLKRELGLLDVFCIASGAMISSGLFILPALAYAKTGPSIVFAYILAGILALPAVLTKAELATAMPKAGGVYFFIERSMGAAAGTVGGLASWFSLSFKSAFALIGIGIFAALIDPGVSEIQVKLIAVGFCLFFMLLNIIGVKQTGRFQIALALFLIGILLFYVLRGFQFVDPQRFVPFAPFGIGSIFATAGLVFISFGGVTKICCVAEEIRNPGRNIPLGMFLAFSFVMLLYAAVVFVTVGILDSAELVNARIPLSLAAGVFSGRPGILLLGFAAFLAFISTANAGILTASRNSMAMGRDYLLPGFFHRVSARFKTPHVSIIATTVFMISVILFLNLENLVKTASTLMILLFIFVNFSLIVMRESKIPGYQPKFRAPLYPWIQIAGIAGYGFLIFKMGRIPLSITGIFIACALAWYLVYARRKVKRQAALVHIIERVTAGDLDEPTLPDELRDIIIERDEIVEDRFDKLIEGARILDLGTSFTMEEFFKEASHFMAEELGVGERPLFDSLVKREKESSTVIRPGLAIPHIVVEGKNKFKVLLARCKEGIIFPDAKSKVHIVFMLAGSRDERNFHLRALAAIAEIAQGPDFDKRWLEARNTEELRHIILLAERKRFLRK